MKQSHNNNSVLIKSRSLTLVDADEETWDKTMASPGSPLISYSWFLCCEKIFSPDSTRVLSIIDKNRQKYITASAALCVKKNIFGFKSFEILGTSTLHEPSGFMFRDHQALEDLVRGIANMKSPVLLARIAEDLPIRDIIRHQSKRIFFIQEKSTRSSQYLNLKTSISDFESSLSSRRRSDLRRAWKKARQAGSLRVDITRPAMDNIEIVLDTAFSVEHKGWKGQNQSSILARPDLEAFFRCYLRDASLKNRLVIGFLYIEDQPVAMQIAVESNSRLWLLKIGHDEKYRNMSPGILLTHEMIKHGIQCDLEGFEFLGSEESWINLWTPDTHKYKLCALYPANISGIIHFAYDTFRRLALRIGRQ